jgi:predicted nucleic acid-binding protein
MKYVIDSSVAFKWVVPESDSDKADRLRDAFRNAVHELLAPDVFSVNCSENKPPVRSSRSRRAFFLVSGLP